MALHRLAHFASAAIVPAALVCLGVMPDTTSAAGRLLDDDVEVFAQERDGAAPGAATAPADENGRDDQRRRANEDDWFRAPVQGAGAYAGPLDFPAAEVHDAVVANARAANARAEFRRAESALSAAVRQAVRSFESSAEFREAVAAEQRAYDAYLDARRDALRDVVSDEKYKAMQDLRQNLAAQLADRRQAPPVTDNALARARLRLAALGTGTDAASQAARDESVLALAELKMRVGSDAREMERDALERSDRVRQARQDLAAAADRLAAVRARLGEIARSDDGITRAKTDLEDARIARLTAEAYFHGADIAAGEALDFAYRLHRYDYVNHPYYSYYPYSYGYTYPYYGYGFHTATYYPLRSAKPLAKRPGMNQGIQPGIPVQVPGRR